MKRLPNIGERVRYAGNWKTMLGVTGIVEKIYPAYRDKVDGEIFEHPAHARVKVDTLPENWPYPGNNIFAPSVDEIQPL